MRIGEICGLKWKDIDLEKREIRVRKTVERIYDKSKKKSKMMISIPKTKNSVRNIPISDKLYKILEKYKNKYDKDCFFLTGKQNKIIEPKSYLNYFRKILLECKIDKKYRFHALRHTFATNCINVGMNSKSLSEILGHSNTRITLDNYVHSSYKHKKKYLERL